MMKNAKDAIQKIVSSIFILAKVYTKNITIETFIPARFFLLYSGYNLQILTEGGTINFSKDFVVFFFVIVVVVVFPIISVRISQLCV